MRISLRKLKPEDLNFVFDSWLKSWRTSRYSGTIPNHLYYQTQRATIEGLVGRGAEFVVATPEGKDDIILGWACGEVKYEMQGRPITVLHYCYVKDPFLGHGIEEMLVNALDGEKPGYISHNLNKALWREWKWIPELARRKNL